MKRRSRRCSNGRLKQASQMWGVSMTLLLFIGGSSRTSEILWHHSPSAWRTTSLHGQMKPMIHSLRWRSTWPPPLPWHYWTSLMHLSCTPTHPRWELGLYWASKDDQSYFSVRSCPEHVWTIAPMMSNFIMWCKLSSNGGIIWFTESSSYIQIMLFYDISINKTRYPLIMAIG